jgi:phenylacetic acid degradation protein
MPCYEMDGLTPVVDPTAYVHPTAVLIGDVLIGPGCYIGPCASLRGDFGRIVVMQGANIQDTCVVHGFPDHDTVVEAGGHIGHGAVLHSCVVREGALVGMNAVVMDGAEVGAHAIVGACAFVPARAVLAPRSMYAGAPARLVRALTEAEIAWKRHGTETYQALAQRCKTGLREVSPLSAPEPGRQRAAGALTHQPLFALQESPQP